VISHGTAGRPGTDKPRSGDLGERELLGRISAGESHAFETIYRIYRPRLARFLISMLRRPQLVEEVLDDTMMVVWQKAASFRASSKVSTWVFAIAYRKALKARSRWPDPSKDEKHPERVSSDPGPDGEIEHMQLHHALVDAMAQLSAEHRAVVDLTYFHGMGYREIAEIVNCPPDTVKTRMFHARRRLRQTISGGLGDWI
jgi:RNA polymerase sigma factor (sigma-70 family)